MCTGATTDYLVIGSDSGRIEIVEWSAATNNWTRVHEETFGRTGVRRIVPGQYLAVDPKGRAIMIGLCLKTLRDCGMARLVTAVCYVLGLVRCPGETKVSLRYES